MPNITISVYVLFITSALCLTFGIMLFMSTVRYYNLSKRIREANLRGYDKSYVISRYNEILHLYTQKESYLNDIINGCNSSDNAKLTQTECIAMNAFLAERILEIYEEIALINTAQDQVKQS